MSLAIFDLDNTLLAGDSDYLWGVFLSEQGLVDKQYYETQNRMFYEQYKAGTLDIFEFHAFSLKPLSENNMVLLNKIHKEFMSNSILPIITQASRNLLQKHRAQGDCILIITATNSFITRPIAQALAVDDIIATEPEIINGEFTGKISGIPCFQEGKVSRLQDWLIGKDFDLSDSWFYSDSINDLPLLEKVANAVAVDPDDKLRQLALTREWPIISLL
ncbi:Phosphoserine phosphatase [hydrothermal vent metagenome]|uniref:Phosphoserine phosphatase n=1 Tax=hydrothermal vent metagenome TaxID=652676 RepID=A0A3B0ZUW9_9ZZZZ